MPEAKLVLRGNTDSNENSLQLRYAQNKLEKQMGDSGTDHGGCHSVHWLKEARAGKSHFDRFLSENFLSIEQEIASASFFVFSACLPCCLCSGCPGTLTSLLFVICLFLTLSGIPAAILPPLYLNKNWLTSTWCCTWVLVQSLTMVMKGSERFSHTILCWPPSDTCIKGHFLCQSWIFSTRSEVVLVNQGFFEALTIGLLHYDTVLYWVI